MLGLETPTPWEFPVTFHEMGTDIICQQCPVPFHPLVTEKHMDTF